MREPPCPCPQTLLSCSSACGRICPSCPCSKHGLEVEIADLDAGRLGPVLLFHFAAKRVAYQQPTQARHVLECDARHFLCSGMMSQHALTALDATGKTLDSKHGNHCRRQTEVRTSLADVLLLDNSIALDGLTDSLLVVQRPTLSANSVSTLITSGSVMS